MITNLTRGGSSAAALLLTTVLAAGGLSVSCSATKAPSNISATVQSTPTQTPAPAPRPIKVGTLLDRSYSTGPTRTPPLTQEQLEKFIAMLQVSGGELAIGYIDDDSDKPFLRLRIDPPPPLPVKPESVTNPLRQSDLNTQYANEMRRFQNILSGWREETDRRITTFRTAAAGFITCLADPHCRSKRTDVVEAVKRADLFLAEPESQEFVRVLFIVSDGQETLKIQAKNPPVLKSHPAILLINGASSTGILKAYQPECFEGIDAAQRRLDIIRRTE